ncbi:hypothetical protein BYT27DRAFT_7099792 [Phlegmacium glaucopus]|nr:hypothetical protein BYT27DRAFT_7099792 [Phlegmacium glaucopus]
MPTSKLVKLANNATSARLSNLISTGYEFADSKCRVTVLRPDQLHRAMRQAVWALFETNMHDLYLNSSLGWDPKAKQKELFHSKSRFILVDSTDLTIPQLLAFSMFRFDDEEDEVVLYCYEVQVATTAKRMGIGKKLMNELTILAGVFNMEKILLTVFKANTNAMQFYKHIGFHIDPSSPNYIEEGARREDTHDESESDVDYEILSKII